MSIYHVPKSFLGEIWPAISDMVDDTTVFHPFMNADDIRTLIENDLLSLFVATSQGSIVGFGCLEVVQYPRCRVANILAAGGRRGFLGMAITELLPFMIDHGKSQGATVVALSGRPGWLRALRHLNGRSQRFVTWWADINEQGWRKLPAPNNHIGTVEAGATVSH